MAEKSDTAEKSAAPVETPAQRRERINGLVTELGKIHDPKKRKEFFVANPDLAEVINPGNFHY